LPPRQQVDNSPPIKFLSGSVFDDVGVLTRSKPASELKTSTSQQLEPLKKFELAFASNFPPASIEGGSLASITDVFRTLGRNLTDQPKWPDCSSANFESRCGSVPVAASDHADAAAEYLIEHFSYTSDHKDLARGPAWLLL
jgi:hypothetical protein